MQKKYKFKFKTKKAPMLELFLWFYESIFSKII